MSNRIRRPQPARTQPIRAWGTLFGAPPLGADAATDAGPASGRDPTAVIGDAVTRSVELGYRVIEEYVRQGQRAAQRMGERSYGVEALGRDVQELTARMAQYASDFLGVWFELMDLAAAGSALLRPNGARPATQHTAPAEPAAPTGEPTRVTIEVTSTRPSEVSLDLRPGVIGRALVVHALHEADPGKPPLTDLSVHAGGPEEPLRLRIRVPDDHPPGVYSGVLVDGETSRPVGTLSVRLAVV